MDIRKRIQFTEKDIQKGYQAHLIKFKPFKTLWAIVTGGLFLILGLLIKVVDTQHHYPGIAIFCIVYGIFLTSIGYYRLSTTGKKLYKGMKDYQKVLHFSFLNDGIKIKNDKQTTNLGWDQFTKAYLKQDLILLYPNDLSFYSFNRSHFSEEEFAALKERVKQKISRIYGS